MSGKGQERRDSEIQDSNASDRAIGSGGVARGRRLRAEERLTLGELTAATDVSVRTVRYYIAEGLLPPPEGSGPRSAYNQGHLDRLRLIQRLKEAYLPLKEIRRRLSGLSDDEARKLLADEDQRGTPGSAPASELLYEESLAGARDYLALLESHEQYRTEPMALQFSAAAAPVAPDLVGEDFRPEPARSRAPRTAAPRATAVPEATSSERKESVAGRGMGLWRRIPLGDEAELVISDRVYERHRDRIDWLVRWAQKVFN